MSPTLSPWWEDSTQLSILVPLPSFSPALWESSSYLGGLKESEEQETIWPFLKSVVCSINVSFTF